jgi:hypothetical protein
MRVVCVTRWTRRLSISFFASRTKRLCLSISMRVVNERTRDWKTRTIRRLIESFVIKRTMSILNVNVVFQKKRDIYKDKQRLANDAQMHINENAFMTLLSAITTLFLVDACDTNMSRISRQTFDASNAHQIKQLDMWKNATIMHRRRRRWTYVSRNHDNRKERMIKFFIDDYFARSTWRKNNKNVFRKIKEKWILKITTKNLTFIIFTWRSLFTFFKTNSSRNFTTN